MHPTNLLFYICYKNVDLLTLCLDNKNFLNHIFSLIIKYTIITFDGHFTFSPIICIFMKKKFLSNIV